MKGNDALPEYQGMNITRGLTELACLLPQELSFGTATRLLGWQTKAIRPAREAAILSESTLRNQVVKHGQIVQKAELKEAMNLLKSLGKSESEGVKPNLVPLSSPQSRRPGWQVDLSRSVEESLLNPTNTPPTRIFDNVVSV